VNLGDRHIDQRGDQGHGLVVHMAERVLERLQRGEHEPVARGQGVEHLLTGVGRPVGVTRGHGVLLRTRQDVLRV